MRISKKKLKGKVRVENRTVTPEEISALHVERPDLGIIIATGGWCGKYSFSTNPHYIKGDGILMAKALGVATKDVDEEHVQYEPTVRLEGPKRGVPVITTLLYEGARLLNANGYEFLTNPRLNKDDLSKAILLEGDYAYYDLERVPVEKLLECNMDPNERIIKVAPAPHASLGGIVIDTECHALGRDGRPVIGIYACGEVTAGVHGFNRLGGNGGTAAMIFGSIAGQQSAAEMKNYN